MTKTISILLLFGFFFAGCYSSKFASYRPVFSTDETWQVRVEKKGFYPSINLIVNDSTIISKSVPVFDWTGINETGNYGGHSVGLLVTYNHGFLGIGSYYSAVVTVDNKYFVGQFRLPTINLSGD